MDRYRDCSSKSTEQLKIIPMGISEIISSKAQIKNFDLVEMKGLLTSRISILPF